MYEWTKDRKNRKNERRTKACARGRANQIALHFISATRMQKLSLFSESSKKKTITIKIVWGHASEKVLGEKRRDNP